MRKALTDAEKGHEEMLRITHDGQNPPYFRFNVIHGLEKVKLDEWKTRTHNGVRQYVTLEHIRSATNHYCQHNLPDPGIDNVHAKIEKCARQLVDYRRRRKEDNPYRWELFARNTFGGQPIPEFAAVSRRGTQMSGN
jgi:hypothetical protein